MRLNQTELKIFEKVSTKTVIRLADIDIVSKSLASTYLNKLIRKGFLEKEGRNFTLSSNRFVRLLANILSDDPSLIEDLANEGIPVLCHIVSSPGLEIHALAKEIGITESSVYPYLHKFMNKQILKKEKKRYFFNKQLWEELFQFVSLYMNYYILEQFKNVPKNAKIYYESPYEIVFSLFTEAKNMKMTAFSEFYKHGIKLYEREMFYRFDQLPKKKISIQTIFIDSLKITSASGQESSRRRLYCYLFYRKNNKFLRKIRHPDLEVLRKIANGKGMVKYDKFPTWKEIKEKCMDYDITI